ncbi:MAG TPA: pirin family protein [Acidimicrobiales bacterium]|nr:pirin family protein [Acidimicrobiales bacterium]
MSGPVTAADAAPQPGAAAPGRATVEITESREGRVGGIGVRRALPRRGRRTVGPWCFVDHMGPAPVTAEHGVAVAPHPHIGLQTVTWLLEGEIVHRDSLGNEQVIRPGQLNLMTAGHGVAHSEEGTGRYRGDLHGVQLWIAQPSPTRDGPPAFEHHGELPRRHLGPGDATVLVGDLDGTTSPARVDTAHVGIDVELRPGTTTVPLRADFEHALVCLSGAVGIDGRTVGPGRLAYLGTGRDQMALTAVDTTRALVLGGLPFAEPLLMWWNYVARTREEILEAHRAWLAADDRFGPVRSVLPRIEVAPPPWAP